MDFKEYQKDPFGYVDRLNLTFRGWNFNYFQQDVTVRKVAFLVAMGSLIAWIVFGFDSSPFQFMYPLFMTKDSILQSLVFFHRLPSLSTLGNLYQYGYGKEMHWSAFVIYGLMFWALSRHFDKNLGITKSKNVVYSSCLTFLSIAVFEFFWMWGFATFQNQPWVITLAWPQLRIILQNVTFATVGGMGVLYMWLDSFIINKKGKIESKLYRFRLDWKAVLLIVASVASASLWVFYPFSVTYFDVTLATGEVWRNSNRFPQTLYTIDLNPNDGVNAGEWFWFEDNAIHGLNTLVKVLFTVTVGYIGLVKPLGDEEKE